VKVLYHIKVSLRVFLCDGDNNDNDGNVSNNDDDRNISDGLNCSSGDDGGGDDVGGSDADGGDIDNVVAIAMLVVTVNGGDVGGDKGGIIDNDNNIGGDNDKNGISGGGGGGSNVNCISDNIGDNDSGGHVMVVIMTIAVIVTRAVYCIYFMCI